MTRFPSPDMLISMNQTTERPNPTRWVRCARPTLLAAMNSMNGYRVYIAYINRCLMICALTFVPSCASAAAPKGLSLILSNADKNTNSYISGQSYSHDMVIGEDVILKLSDDCSITTDQLFHAAQSESPIVRHACIRILYLRYKLHSTLTLIDFVTDPSPLVRTTAASLLFQLQRENEWHNMPLDIQLLNDIFTPYKQYRDSRALLLKWAIDNNLIYDDRMIRVGNSIMNPYYPVEIIYIPYSE